MPMSWKYAHGVVQDRLGVDRHIEIAMPLSPGSETPVVFCADGQAVKTYCRSLSQCSTISLPFLIGVHSREETRAQDYLYSQDARYLAHEQLFVDQLPSWLARECNIRTLPAHSVIFGVSNGGSFALTTGLRHPRSFAAVFSFSAPRISLLPTIDGASNEMPSVYLSSGRHGAEKSIRKNVLQLARWLKTKDIVVNVAERDTGHTMDFWASELPVAVDWFHRQKK